MSKKKLSFIAIFVLLVGFFIYFKEFSLPGFVSDKLTAMMKVNVKLEGLDLGFKQVEADGLSILNPKGFNLPKAMSINSILIQAPWTAFFKNDIEIDQLELSEIYVGVEFLNKSSKQGNWSEIMTNLQAAAPKQPASSSGKHVHIKKCILTNLQVELAYSTGNPGPKLYPLIKRLEINDIDSRNGLPLQEISQAILNATLKQIFSIENLTNMALDNFTDAAKMPFKLPFLKGLPTP
jgi:hypothetical protein